MQNLITINDINTEIAQVSIHSRRREYLTRIVSKATYMTAQVGKTPSDIQFSVDEYGDILPYGRRPVYSAMFK